MQAFMCADTANQAHVHESPALEWESGIQEPECPRCGYGLTGVVRSWTDACPLQGRCSECGLEFEWRDALNPQFSFPRWCVEGDGGRSVPLRAIRTMLMMFRPWRFWRELQMQHPVRWWRISLVFVLIVPLLYLVFAISAGLATWDSAKSSATVGVRKNPPWVDALQAGAMLNWFSTPTRSGPMPSTAINLYKPFRIVSAGWHSIRFKFDGRSSSYMRPVIAERGFTLICTVLGCPLGFILLPISRRVAKVRWRHVLRISLYSLLLAAFPLAIDIYAQLREPRSIQSLSIADIMLMLGLAAAAAWWGFAIHRYLRMRHAWLVAAYVILFAFLVQYFILQCVDLLIELLN
jgi:hypothetical protein